MRPGPKHLVLLLLANVLAHANVPSATATGINLFWNDCSAGPTAMTYRSFACNTNVGTNVLTASFEPTAGLTALNGNNLILDVYSLSNSMPPWWRFKNVGTCRLASISANTVFGLASCAEPWGAPGTPSITAYLENVGGDVRRARIGGAVSVGDALQGPVAPDTEYYSLNIVVNNAKTVGTGACAGCQDDVCIILNEIKLTQPAGAPGGSPVITNPLNNNYVRWQGFLPLCFTPTVNRTWGQLKGIYR